MRDERKKPIAKRISTWGDCTEVVYSCPDCGASLAILGEKNKFCFNCGCPLEWSVVTKVTPQFRKFIYSDEHPEEREASVIKWINECLNPYIVWDGHSKELFEKVMPSEVIINE